MSTDKLPIDEFTIEALKELSFKKAITMITVVSIAAIVFLFWLIYFRGGAEYSQDSFVAYLPTLNVLFNSFSIGFLFNGYVAVRNRNYRKHMRMMLAAFVCSTLFLVSYVIYHTFHGHTVFPGTGGIRILYLTILFSHIVLSAVIVPMILGSFYLAFSGNFRLHKKLSRFTFPVWMYVSVTGVFIYIILNMYT